jgi:hypothetical protein
MQRNQKTYDLVLQDNFIPMINLMTCQSTTKIKDSKSLTFHTKNQKVFVWARNLTQQLYDNEEYTLQIDSHMRFAPNWDDEMIKMIKQLQKKGHEKPLLTGYVFVI